MSRIKVCPVCGERNPEDAFDCGRCGELLLGPAQDEPPPGPTALEPASPSATVFERKLLLRLEAPDGSGGLELESGALIGREASGGEWLARRQTVSRRHARVRHDGTQWFIEDLGSTNGTWVNERLVKPGTPCPIRPGDSVALSKSCVLKVNG